MSGNVTIDISRYPESRSGVQSDDKGYYYTDQAGGRVNLTDEWYPDPEGIYRKITHSLEGGYKIGDIKKGGESQTGFPDLGSYSSVSVYYWSLDNTFKNPLLIQLGTGNGTKFYTSAGRGSNWTDANINTGKLKQKLDEQNCLKNKTHQIDISKKSSGNMNTSYPCPSCGNKWNIQTQDHIQSQPYFTYSTHSIPGYGNLSVSGFKEGTNWQLGLPSIMGVPFIYVFFYPKGSGTPVLIHYEQGGHNYFRRNKSTGNTWTAVSQDKALKLLNDQEYYPKITIKLSMPADAPYPDEGTKINITVRNAPLGNGYWKYDHSLNGGLFELKDVTHKDAPLSGISSNYPIESVTAYYNGDDYITKDPILVELAVKNTSKTGYIYYGKSTARQNSWYVVMNYSFRCTGEDLKKKLQSMRETKPSPSKTTDIIEGSIISADVLAGGGAIGLSIWKGPAINFEISAPRSNVNIPSTIPKANISNKLLENSITELTTKHYQRFINGCETSKELMEAFSAELGSIRADLQFDIDKKMELFEQLRNEVSQLQDYICNFGNVKHRIKVLSSDLEQIERATRNLKDSFVISEHELESSKHLLRKESSHLLRLQEKNKEINDMIYNNVNGVNLKDLNDRIYTLRAEISTLVERIKEYESEIPLLSSNIISMSNTLLKLHASSSSLLEGIKSALLANGIEASSWVNLEKITLNTEANVADEILGISIDSFEAKIEEIFSSDSQKFQETTWAIKQTNDTIAELEIAIISLENEINITNKKLENSQDSANVSRLQAETEDIVTMIKSCAQENLQTCKDKLRSVLEELQGANDQLELEKANAKKKLESYLEAIRTIVQVCHEQKLKNCHAIKGQVF